jgi:hypothetical protein
MDRIVTLDLTTEELAAEQVVDVSVDGQSRPDLQFSIECAPPEGPGDGGDGGAGNAPADDGDDSPSLAVGWFLTVAAGAAMVALGRRD